METTCVAFGPTCPVTLPHAITTLASKLVQNESGSSNTNTNQCRYQVPLQTSFTTTYSCTASGTGGSTGGTGGGLTQKEMDYNMAMRVADGSIEYLNYEEGARQADEELIYEWLRLSDSLRGAVAILDSFYYAHFSASIGQMNTVDWLISRLADSVVLEDSILWQHTLDSAYNINNEILSEEVFETNAQFINNVYLRTMELGIQDITLAEWEQIEALANNCPLHAGTAVYRARAVWDNYAPGFYYNDLVICNSMNVYKGGISPLQEDLIAINNYTHTKDNTTAIYTDNNTIIEIYPNPTSSQINIKYNIDKKQEALFELYDVLGHKVKEIVLHGNVSFVSFSVNDLPKGLFNYKIILGNETIKNGKIVIE